MKKVRNKGQDPEVKGIPVLNERQGYLLNNLNSFLRLMRPFNSRHWKRNHQIACDIVNEISKTGLCDTRKYRLADGELSWACDCQEQIQNMLGHCRDERNS